MNPCQCPACLIPVTVRRPRLEYVDGAVESVVYGPDAYHYLQVTSEGEGLVYVPAVLEDYPTRRVLASRAIVDPILPGSAPRRAAARSVPMIYPTPGPRENSTRAYLVRHGIEHSSRTNTYPRVPRIPDETSREGRAAAMVVRAHRATYPDAYVTEHESQEITRLISARTSFSPIGAAARALPQYGAPRETMSARGRRYDIDDRTSRDLEAAADAILRDAGDDVHRVDVIDRWTYRPEVSPDRVAYRGAVRYRPHACHRSERIVTGPRTIARADGRLITRKGTVTLLIDSGTPGTEVLVTLARTSIALPSGARVHLFGCVGRGWHGRRVVVMPKVTRRDEAGQSVGKRGPAVSIWVAAPTSVAARWKKATDEQHARAVAYRTSLVADGTLVLGSGAVLIIDGQSSTGEATTDRTRVRVLIDDQPTDRGYSLVDVVRRAVLAG